MIAAMMKMGSITSGKEEREQKERGTERERVG